MLVVLDANVAFRALVAGRADVSRRVGAPDGIELCAPFALLSELFEHKERILDASALSPEELAAAFHRLAESILFVREAGIPLGVWVEAARLCRGVDEDDTPYVALALHLGALLWTEDGVLKDGLRARGFDRFFEP